ncbi:MAG: glycosyltransferase family 2 protein [Pseudomonadota bacterium]
MKAPEALHVLVLTFNEERHIGRCLASVAEAATTITVIDSGSTDRTVEIAAAQGARVIEHPWVNHAAQMNHAIDSVAGRGGWLMRIDADEVLEEGAAARLRPFLVAQDEAVAGIAVRRRMVFMGRRIRFGGMEPSWQLRLLRNGRGRCEQRWMDEHFVTDGEVVRSPFVITDINLKPITQWVNKHNDYASREALELLNVAHGLYAEERAQADGTSPGAAFKRFVKTKIYSRLPGGGRSTLYFLARYFLLLGFLDGKEGFYFHSMQAFWYRTLVDAKVTEIERYAATHNVPLADAVKACTGLDITQS